MILGRKRKVEIKIIRALPVCVLGRRKDIKGDRNPGLVNIVWVVDQI